MSKIQSLVDILVEKYSLSPADSEQFVREMFAVIREKLIADKLVKVKGLGTFKQVEVNGRSSVDVNTGERILIEGHSKISFTPENAVRDRINAPFIQFESFEINDDASSDFDKIDTKYTEANSQEPAKEEPAVEAETPVETVVESVTDAEQPAEVMEEPTPIAENVVEETAQSVEEKPETVTTQTEETSAEVPATTPVVNEAPASVVEEIPTVSEEPVSAVEEEIAPIVEETPTPSNEETVVPVQSNTLYDNPNKEETPAKDEEPAQTESVSRDSSAEDLREELKHTNTLVKLLIGIVIFLVICIIAFGVYVFVNHNQTTTPVPEPAPAVVDTPQVAPAAVEQEVPETTEPQEEELDPKDYKVVGVADVIVMEKSQSYKDVAEDHGGEYMRDFIREANGGKKDFEKGDSVIIPKVEKKE